MNLKVSSGIIGGVASVVGAFKSERVQEALDHPITKIALSVLSFATAVILNKKSLCNCGIWISPLVLVGSLSFAVGHSNLVDRIEGLKNRINGLGENRKIATHIAIAVIAGAGLGYISSR